MCENEMRCASPGIAEGRPAPALVPSTPVVAGSGGNYLQGWGARAVQGDGGCSPVGGRPGPEERRAHKAT